MISGVQIQFTAEDDSALAVWRPESVPSQVLIETIQTMQATVRAQFGEGADIALRDVQEGSWRLLFCLLLPSMLQMSGREALASLVESQREATVSSERTLHGLASELIAVHGKTRIELTAVEGESLDRLQPLEGEESRVEIVALAQAAAPLDSTWVEIESWGGRCVGLRLDNRHVWVRLVNGRVVRLTADEKKLGEWQQWMAESTPLQVDVKVTRGQRSNRILRRQVMDARVAAPATLPVLNALEQLRGAFSSAGIDVVSWWQTQRDDEEGVA